MPLVVVGVSVVVDRKFHCDLCTEREVELCLSYCRQLSTRFRCLLLEVSPVKCRFADLRIVQRVNEVRVSVGIG